MSQSSQRYAINVTRKHLLQSNYQIFVANSWISPPGLFSKVFGSITHGGVVLSETANISLYKQVETRS